MIGKTENRKMSRNYVIISNRFKSETLTVKDIRYVEQKERKVTIHLMDYSVWENSSMEDILSRMDDRNIIRCHHSLAVNIDHISSFLGDRQLELDNGRVLTMCKAACLRAKRGWKDSKKLRSRRFIAPGNQTLMEE